VSKTMSKTLQGHRIKLNKTKTKSTVFSSRQNVVSDGAFLTDDGRLFRARAKATGKARSPSVERLVDGTTSIDVSRAQTASSVNVRCPETALSSYLHSESNSLRCSLIACYKGIKTINSAVV